MKKRAFDNELLLLPRSWRWLASSVEGGRSWWFATVKNDMAAPGERRACSSGLLCCSPRVFGRNWRNGGMAAGVRLRIVAGGWFFVLQEASAAVRPAEHRSGCGRQRGSSAVTRAGKRTRFTHTRTHTHRWRSTGPAGSSALRRTPPPPVRYLPAAGGRAGRAVAFTLLPRLPAGYLRRCLFSAFASLLFTCLTVRG